MAARAYYNEIDPFAADWLRNLISAELIVPGDVDERDLWDVTPDELRGYTQVHLCAGIGVWSYALRLAGWSDDRPCWTASFPCQPFSAAGKGEGFADERHLWPAGFHLIRECRPGTLFGEQVASKDALQWIDLVQTDLEAEGYAFGAADLCAAGVAVGFEQGRIGQETLAWIQRAVPACPDAGLARELADFAEFARREVGLGAPHIRQRLYWVGVADGPGSLPRRSAGAAMGQGRAALAAGSPGAVAHSLHPGRPERRSEPGLGPVAGSGESGELADARRHECGARRSGGTDGDGTPQPAGCGDAGLLADANFQLCDDRRSDPGHDSREQQESPGLRGGEPVLWGCGLLADAPGERRDGGQDPAGPERGTGTEDGGILGDPGQSGLARRAGEPRDDGPEQPATERAGGAVGGLGDASDPERDGRSAPGAGPTGLQHAPESGPLGGFWADAVWIYCRDEKWRPVEPILEPLADGAAPWLGRVCATTDGQAYVHPLAVGAPSRVGRLKGYGNCINASLAAEFVRAYLDARAEPDTG